MSWLGWDWGNVPAWLSTGSILVALGVFSRDHVLRIRKQVESVGILAEVKEPDDADKDALSVVEITIQDTSDHPIYLAFVQYTATICCVDTTKDPVSFPAYRILRYTEYFPED